MKITKQTLIDYFNKPGVNKSGICKEAGVSIQHLNRVLHGVKGRKPDNLTDNLKEKLRKAIEANCI